MADERVRRRLAAVLAADVAGYSLLIGEDETGTRARFNSCLDELIGPAIANRQGRIVKTTGDGILVEFASIVEAVECAVEIQEGMSKRNAGQPDGARMDFRIGVNLGDVIVEGDDIHGDGVNVAARLEQSATPGGICLSEDAYRQIRGKLAVPVSDDGEHRFKNMRSPVRVYRIATADAAAAPTPPAVVRRARRRAFSGVIGAVALFGLAAGAWYLLVRDRPDAARGPPMVAVLPFANLTGERDQDYLADGVTEEVINALGRFNTLRVIGRNAVLLYKSRPPTRDEISAVLGAQYVVEGSIRRSAKQVRIAVQLTGAHDGAVLWSDRYDGQFSNLFDLQDAIARQIAGRFAVNIRQIESRRSLDQPRPKPDAHDLVLRARAVGIAATRTANRRFRELLTEAVAMDPSYATAHALLAEGLYAQSVLGWSQNADRSMTRAEELARRAIALAPDEPDGHRVLGRILVVRAEHQEALNELRRAIAINPSDAGALAGWGAVLSFNGDLDGAIGAIETARRYDPMLEPVYVLDLSVAYYLTRQHGKAIRVAEEGLSRFPEFAMFYLPAAAAAAQLGEADRAARFVKQIRLRLPFLDLEVIGSRFKDPAYREYLAEGLKSAGL